MADPKATPDPETNTRDSWPEILKRAPVETLRKCLFVCKKWYYLITSPSFITAHALSLSSHQTHLFLLREFDKPKNKPSQETYRIISDGPENPLPETRRKIPCPFKPRRGLYFRVVGTVNGVILLSDDSVGRDFAIVLWNPLVRKYIELPQPGVKFVANEKYMFVLGFGYDCASDDYKVARACYRQRRDNLDMAPPMVELYSVKEGNWRWVDARGVDYCIPDTMWSQCFMRGNIHWVAFDRRDDDCSANALAYKSTLLLLFDVEKERFKKMRLPPPLRKANPIRLEVCEHQGMLALRCSRMGIASLGFDLWVKKEYKLGKSWSKLFSADVGLVPKALNFRSDGKILLVDAKAGVSSYDPKTGRKESVGGHALLWSGFACSFTESLVFLGKGSRAVSYGEGQILEPGRLVAGCANVSEKALPTGGSSGADDESSFSEACECITNSLYTGIAGQMKKFRWYDFEF